MSHPPSLSRASFSLSRILMASLLVFALVPAGIVALLLARSNLRALDDLGARIVSDVARRVQVDTESHLRQAHAALNAVIPENPTPEQTRQALAWLEKPEDAEALMASVVRQSENVAYVFQGTASGNFFGVEKIADGLRVNIRGPKDVGRRYFLAREPGDRSKPLPTEESAYEPRTRPWYQKAEATGRRAFSPIYKSASRQQLMVTLAQPVYTANRELAGVFAADLFLKRLADLLVAQSVSARGVAYLVDEAGLLVATSENDAQGRQNVDRLERITPETSRDPVVRASYAALKHQFRADMPLSQSMDGQVQRLQPEAGSADTGRLIAVQHLFGTGLGLRWVLVVAAPEADFTGELRRALVASLSIMAGLVGLAALVAYYIAARVGRQLRLLEQAAGQLGRGDVPAVLDTRFSEVQQLSQVMRGSAEQIQGYRAQLEDHARRLEQTNATLEQRVTERTAELAASREEALAAARAKAAFLATMSHEIRTPMNGVLGMSALLAGTPLNAEQREWLQTIRVSGDQLLSVINDILDFSKIESGKLELEAEPVGVRGAVEQACAIAGLKARDKGLDLHIDVAADVPPAIRGDITRIRQVLINLINNAVKFTEQGSVTVQVQRVAGNAGAHGPTLRFAVHDTGIGIPADRVGALFQAFTQVDVSTTRKYGGTGLGLAICKRLVETMGGQIGVDSVPGTGSSFWFTLTAPEAEPPAEVDDTAQVARDTRGLTVLVADDNPVNLQVASAMLGRLGYAVQTAANGREALDAVGRTLAQGGPGHLGAVLMDVNMPELDGLQATQLIIAQHGDAAPPVIAMTASILTEERQRCVDAGMVGSVFKPLRIDDLAAALARWAREMHADAINSGAAYVHPASLPADFYALDGLSNLPLVDRARLEEFKEYDDENLSVMRGVVGMYLNDAPHRLDAMEAAIAARDAAALYKAVHALKGSAGNVGALALEALCLPLELPSGQGEVPEDSALQLQRIRECAERTAQALAAWV